jgi:hypothetical protein
MLVPLPWRTPGRTPASWGRRDTPSHAAHVGNARGERKGPTKQPLPYVPSQVPRHPCQIFLLFLFFPFFSFSDAPTFFFLPDTNIRRQAFDEINYKVSFSQGWNPALEKNGQTPLGIPANIRIRLQRCGAASDFLEGVVNRLRHFGCDGRYYAEACVPQPVHGDHVPLTACPPCRESQKSESDRMYAQAYSDLVVTKDVRRERNPKTERYASRKGFLNPRRKI